MVDAKLPVPRPNTHIERLDFTGDTVRLIQITDTHLCENPGGTLLGMDTDNSLQLVIDAVGQERGRPDVILLTGDLSDQGSASAYARMNAYSQPLSDACFWLPGNHDDREKMAGALAGSNCLSREIRIGKWQILMLDSQVPGLVGGELGAAQLSFLQSALGQASAEGLSTLICLHHHPVLIGCAWLGEELLADADLFFDAVDSHNVVRGILWGHIHQQVDINRSDVLLMGSPSSCVQFAPNSEHFKVDDVAPGYRWLDLHPDGSIDTAVSRLKGAKLTVDLDSGGYL